MVLTATLLLHLAAALTVGQARAESAGARARRYDAWRSSHPDTDRTIDRLVWESAPRVLRTRATAVSVWDCAECPEMTVVPAAAFTIGSPAEEPGRGKDEGPQRRVLIPAPFAVSRHEITRGEYRVFLRESGRPVLGGCVTDRAHLGTWAPEPSTTLDDPGFAQTDDHPVVCVTWDDAQAYVGWLNAKTSGGYRLLTEAEWEFAARAGTTSAYPWGPDVNDGCPYANTADATVARKYPDWTTATCRDGAVNTSPVGSYLPNRFGLYDMIGNVEEWVEDCATDSYDTLPADGRANLEGDCTRHVVRSSSWGAFPKDSRVANRVRYRTGQVDDSIGFRVAKTLRR